MRRTLLILAPIVVLAALAFLAYGPFSDPSPESRVQAYLEATARGDEGRALGIWQTCCAPTQDLEARRLDLTRELAAACAGLRQIGDEGTQEIRGNAGAPCPPQSNLGVCAPKFVDRSGGLSALRFCMRPAH